MKYIFTILLCSVLGSTFAQQYPKVSQYMINPDFLNPAAVGSRGTSDLKLSYRKQWVGVEGAPETMVFNFNSPIYIRSQYSHIGLGLQVYNDRIGDFNTTSVMPAMSYHIDMGGWHLAPGGSAGIISIGIDDRNILLTQQDDPRAYNQMRETTLDFNFGIWAYSQNFFAGIATQQLLLTAENPKKGVLESEMHYNLMAGHRFYIVEEAGVGFVPSVLIQTNGKKSQLTPSVMVRVEDVFWFGTSYNVGESYTLMVGGRIYNPLSNTSLLLNYSYEHGNGVKSPIRATTHEITLGFGFRAIVPNHVKNSNVSKVRVRAYD